MILTMHQHRRIAARLRKNAETFPPEKRRLALESAKVHLFLAKAQLARPELRPKKKARTGSPE